MIKGSVRGGQIFLHNLRMFRQIAAASLQISTLIAVLAVFSFNYTKIKSLDWDAFFSLEKERFIELCDFTAYFGQLKDPYVVVSIKGENYGMQHSKVLRNSYLLKNEAKIINFAIDESILVVKAACMIYLTIFLGWWIIGNRSKASVIKNDNQILSSLEVKQFLKAKKIASDIMLGDMPIVKDSETKHILVMGSTGTGKTNCFHTILRQVRAKHQPALILDLNGDMIARYYDPKRGDKIINPFDKRGISWDFWNEIEDSHYISIIASSIFSGKGSSYDEMWNNNSKQVFQDAVEYLIDTDNKSIEYLYNILATDPLKQVHAKLEGRPSASLMDPISDKTAQSIRANIIAFIGWLKYLNQTSESYSTREWISNVQKSKEGWLFVSCPPDMVQEFQPIFTIIFELFLRRLMKLGKCSKRRVWVVTDELPANGKIPSLKTAAAQIRKYGGCILSAIQLMDQLYDVYGHNVAKVLLSQFNTKIIFRTDDSDAAKILSQIAGEIELQEASESVSYGAHEMRDGIQIGQHNRTKLVITAKDLARLADLEALVKLPAPGLQFAKIQMNIVKDKDKNQHFIERVVEVSRAKPKHTLVHNQTQDDLKSHVLENQNVGEIEEAINAKH